MVRWSRLWMLALLLALLTFGMAPRKSVVWDRIDVVLTIQPDGTVDVEERWQVTFEGGPFRFGYRNIETRYLTAITDVQVLDEQGPYQLGTSELPRTFIVSDEGNQVVIRWFFAPVSDTTRSFVLRYRVHGALRFYTGGEQFWWQAVFSDRDVPVLASTVTVHAPGPIQNAAAYFVPARIEKVDENTVRFIAEKQIPANTPFEVRVEWPAGVVGGTPAPWQAEADAEAQAREREALWEQRWRPVAEVVSVTCALSILILGLLALYLLWYTKGRDPYVEVYAEYLTEPPSDLPPALAGVVIDEEVSIKEIMATLLDLARRGYLEVFEERDDFRFRITGQPVALRDFEKVLVQHLFQGSREKRLTDWKHIMGKSTGRAIVKAIFEEAHRLGLFPHNPQSVRRKYMILGFVLDLIIVFTVLPFIAMVSPWVHFFWCIPAALWIVGAGLIFVGYFMPRKTRKGAEEAAKWRAFRRYLESLDRVDVDRAEEILERYLPYAVAFGVEDRFLKRLEEMETRAGRRMVTLPPWYHTHLPGETWSSPSGEPSGKGARPATTPSLSDASRRLGTGLSQLSRGIGSMLSTAATTLAASSSSSSGGFSGGGSIGGGGGGGGGGGFG